jgi:ribonuclease D
MGELVLSKEQINALPLGGFAGPAAVAPPDDLGAALGRLSEATEVGIDTESRPSFARGEHHPISLIQLATADAACLIRVPRDAVALPPLLLALLENDAVAKVAQGPRDELRELESRFGLQARNVVDLVPLAKRAGCRPLSLRGLVAIFLGIRIPKGAQTSNWEATRLADRQVRYAATDAWACLAVFSAMRKRGLIA